MHMSPVLSGTPVRCLGSGPRRPGAWERVAWAIAVLGFVVGGCAKAPIPTGPSLEPTANVYLRSAFDTDPSGYLGRFLPEDQGDLDEADGMALACSVHLSWRFVEGGNVETTEVFRASSGLQAHLGVPMAGQLRSTGDAERLARVAYTLTGKMVTTVEDPAAFASCCKAQPDQCTDRMVGEFLQGTGSVYLESAQGRSFHAEAATAEAGGALVVESGVSWRRAVVFPEPVYFAFKATPTPYRQRPVRTCSGWTPKHPEPADGIVLRAASGPAWTEQAARRQARTALADQLERATGLVAEAEKKGTVLGLQELDWCLEWIEKAGQVHHAAHVLGVVTPEEQRRVRDLPMPVVEPPPPRTVRVACAPWVDALPTASDGLFVVGRHALPAMTRSGARLRATVNAHSQAGWATGLGAVALSRGTTLAVQERASCVERTSTGGYRAFMLAFVSDAEQRRIRSISVHPDPSKMESTSVEVR